MTCLHNHSSFCYYLFISAITTLYFLSSLPIINSLSTVSISQTSNQTFICALQHSIQQGQSNLNCTSFPPAGIGLQLNPNVSYSEIVGGDGFLCALLRPSSSSSSTSIMGCWRFSGSNATNVVPYKRIYRGPLTENMDAGNSHVCSLVTGRSNDLLECWKWPGFNSSSMGRRNMSAIAVGENFVCGLSSETGKVTCRGNNSIVVGHEPSGSYSVIAAGFWHACAISSHDGSLDCWGDMTTILGGDKPQGGTFISLALGESRSCALRYNGTVVCWGSKNFSMPKRLQGTFFEAIVAHRSVFCGVVSLDYSLVCWGNEIVEANSKVFDNVLPGPCRKECPCQPLSGSAKFCDSPGFSICKPCPPTVIDQSPLQWPNASPPQRTAEESDGLSNKMVAFLVVGCVGCSFLFIVVAFFLYRYCRCRGCRVHDSGRLEEDESGTGTELQEAEAVHPRGILEKRLSHVISMGNGSNLDEFSLQLLVEATNNFSEEKKIGSGSFGSVYHATLLQEDGTNKEVAIKRADMLSTSASSHGAVLGGTKRQQDQKDSAFVSELEALSRLHHKNLVQLLGYYEDMNELILVYEYMNNGSLNDHLHHHRLESSPLMSTSWACRIKAALDAARGIEYLHHYATPPIIHRDIKSSNILLDANLIAKVSDFGLSLMGPEDDDDDDHSHLSLMAAGTIGYMDPQYYRLHHLTTKSDVYSFGVVLLEMLSGHRAIHKNENGVPRNVVDFAVPYVVQDEIHKVLDPRVPPPTTPFEMEAVVYVCYLAVDCVSVESRDRPTMTQVVNSLERALAVCLTTQPILPSRSTTTASFD